MSYCSLHSHTYYSVLDGISKPIELARAAVAMDMKALAITDHGTLAGWPEFALACKDIGIKPIFGVEAYFVPNRKDHETFKSPTKEEVRSGYHLVLLAKNETGCHNIIRLNNIANVEGFYYKPKIDWEVLMKHREGLIVGSACVASELNQHILGEGDALAVAKRFKDAFGEDYYLEVMDNQMSSDDQRNANKGVIKIAKKLGIRVVPTNDSHYINATDQQIHDLTLAIKTKKQLSGPDRLKYDGLFHLKTMEEMKRLFPDYISNTEAIAERIQVCNIFSDSINVPISISDPDDILGMLATGGLSYLEFDTKPEYVDRLNRELAMIKMLGMSSYFLATKDIVDAIKSIGCEVGWGRGSAGGSLVCYCLGITRVDPIKYNLLFERFMNQYRKDWPDIDLDIPQSLRKRAIQKIGEKFGEQNVAHISTVLYFNPKILIRDICRAIGKPVHEADRLSLLVPFECKNAEDLETMATDLKVRLDKMSEGKLIWDRLIKLLGIPRHVGVHPSGIVISSEPIFNQLPIRCEHGKKQGKDEGKAKYIVQFPMHFHKERDKKETISILDKFGLLKFDILGLKTLDVIFRTSAEVGLDIHKIPFDDPKIFDFLCKGNVAGVFQLDNHKKAIDICKQMKPKTLEDVAAVIALNRPGMIDSGELDVYLLRRFGSPEESWYFHPSLKEVLEPNYGVCLYQEDLMKMAQVYAGYSLDEAEDLRKGIGKKDRSIVEKNMQLFLEKATKLGHPPEEVQRILKMIEAAGRYSFNKSHAVGYAMITYASAYLAVYYPLHFFKNVIALEDTDKRSFYLSQAMIRGIKLTYPDVNLADEEVSVDEKNNAIRMGLLSIKRIGEIIAQKIIAGRPYSNIADLEKKVGKATTALLHAAKATQSMPDFASYQPKTVVVMDEVELLGISIGGLQKQFQDIIDQSGAQPVHEILTTGITVAKILEVKEHVYTPKNDARPVERTMAFVKLMDVFGPQSEVLAFDDVYKKKAFQKDKFYVIILEALSRGGWKIASLSPVAEPAAV